ncbi:SDR family oxidoreductase [Streptomyces sp. NBC_01198]|uniref:SDR family oxidoreductase n=1 Tax=Streptomyces sp. NBC_01198 TaxID=2903769 RepID=UPI002E0FDB9D|nr:SDR family oxidoreductase [Streptomyces sp. NBC_01198]
MKHYVITGSGSGIGQAVADRLNARGATLHLPVRTPESAERVARRYPGAHTIIADLAEPAALEKILHDSSLPDTVDGLLHVAGTLNLGPVADLTPRTWETTLAVNLMAPAELTRLMLPRLRHPAGHVIFVNSTSGLDTRAGCSAYSAAKYGLRALADALRAEEQQTGLRVTSLYPSRTATPMQERMQQHEGRVYDPACWIDPSTLAVAILTALDLPPDAAISDITVRVGNGQRR